MCRGASVRFDASGVLVVEALRRKYAARYEESERLHAKAAEKAHRLRDGSVKGQAKAAYIMALDTRRRAKLDVDFIFELSNHDLKRAEEFCRTHSNGEKELADFYRMLSEAESLMKQAREVLEQMGVTVRDVRG